MEMLMPRVEMLSTGDEVLYGQIVDTNSAWLADYLFEQGFPMTSRSTVGDSMSSLVDVLLERSQLADVLIVNGGLGPTSDDLTAQAAAKACGVELVENSDWIATMQAFFAERGRPMSDSNRKQALLPANAELIDNPVGTACGFMLRLNKCQIFFTPGVPFEFKAMVEQQILPRLQQRYPDICAFDCLRLSTFGCSESDLAMALDPLPLPEGVVLGYRSAAPVIELKLTGPGSQQQAMAEAFVQVKKVVGDRMVFEGTKGLAAQLATLLEQADMQLAVSEGFSAGLLNWQLQSAGVALAGGALFASRPGQAGVDLDDLSYQAQALASFSGSPLALVVGPLNEGQVSVVLVTPEKTHGVTIGYQAQRHSLRLRQETIAMLAMDMLRRYLQNHAVLVEYPWLTRMATC
jgi:competence/damage-inducible protein CinA-like protein